MKALLLLIGLTFSITIFAADPAPADSKMGQTEGCSSNQALENCECVVDNAGSEAGADNAGSGTADPSGTATRGGL